MPCSCTTFVSARPSGRFSGQHTGRSDIPLTAHGEAQARALSSSLQWIQFTRVLSSPRQRARRTCELAGLGSAAAIDADLAEWDYGNYEGQRSVEICRARPDWNVFRDGCSGGENPALISERADRLIARLRASQGNVALFSHGQFGSAFAARWIALAVSDGQHFVLGASLSILGHEPGHPDVRVMTLWNATPRNV